MVANERAQFLLKKKKFLNLYQDEENASMCFGIMLKSNDIPLQ
jgi:hypothetical protein